jgi:hypothetical protein
MGQFGRGSTFDPFEFCPIHRSRGELEFSGLSLPRMSLPKVPSLSQISSTVRKAVGELRGVPVGWDEYRRRRFWCWMALLSYVPGLFVFVYLGRLIHSGIPAWIVLFGCIGTWQYCAWSMMAFRCPRCGRLWHWQMGLGRHCGHCGLRKWEDPVTVSDQRSRG